ncbi:zinc ribbon domain-containing protein [Occultella glacieicola]|uniref:Zinc ribbon domain-containing protein n=1 Tax=Occultella glacieicola TaxID=2518684 RepID=A0ABY2E9N9_9MICO|nr:zinc ribbon domain-containing protein [Occultella glacieicola]TDE98784.1 zinc ribbon domain-containing protein [Occultella glacieicola]
MVICPECGTRNEVGEQFCGGCGTYLEWEEAESEEAAEPAPQPEPELEPELVPDRALSPEPDLAHPGAPEPDGPRPAEPARALPPDAVPDRLPEPERVPEPAPGRSAEVTRATTRPAPPAPGPAPEPAPGPAPEPTPGPAPEPTPGPEAPRTTGPAREPVSASEPGAQPDPVPEPAPQPPADSATEAAPSGTEPARPPGQPHQNGTPDRETVEQSKPAAMIAPALVAPPVPRKRRSTRDSERPASGATGGQRPGAPVPVADQPGAQSPGTPQAVRPGAAKPRPKPRPVPEDEPPPAPGDLICGNCGTGNVPTRKFCRRCGTSLAEAKVQPTRSWWRRLLRPDAKPGPAAGTRPKTRRRRFPTRLVSVVVILGLLTAAGLYFRPELERAYQSVLDRAQGNATVNPTAFTASSEGTETPATNLGDGTNDRAWMPAAPGPSAGQWVEVTFAQPFRMVRILVTSGASSVQEDFLAQDRPQTVTVTITTDTGAQVSEDVVLEDVAGAQSVELVAEGVVAVRMTVVDTWDPRPETYVAIAELEFRGRE